MIKMKGTKTWWLGWLLPWAGWVLSTTLGWLLGFAMSAGAVMSSAIWDPDEVETYLRSSPWERAFSALLFGAVVGVILGVSIGLLQWLLLRRRAKDAVLSVLAMIVGSALLCSTARIGPSELESDFTIGLRAGAVGGAIAGWVAGSCQWLILRRRVRRADGWTLLTTFAWAIGWAIIWGATSPLLADEGYISSQIFFLAMPLVGGTIAGLGQWLLLRHNVKRAGWWIPATAVSWGIAPIFGGFTIAPGAVIGVITATALVLLLSFQ